MPRTLVFAISMLLVATSAAAETDDCPVASGQISGDDAAAESARIVAEFGTERLTLRDLDGRIATELCQLRMDFRRRLDNLRGEALDAHVDRTLLEREAKRKKQTNIDTLLDAEVTGKVTPPTDAEIRAFYEANRGRIDGTLEETHDGIGQHLIQQAAQEAYAAYIGRLRSDAGVKIDLPRLRIRVEPKGYGDGPADAPVTIVEFSDFECPFCAQGAPIARQLVAKYPGQVRVVFRDFPLDFHAGAHGAAIAARCAGRQRRFWPMHDRLFAQQDRLDRVALVEHGRTIDGIDAAAFEKCLDDPAVRAEVDADIEAGKRAGVTGTPAFFINGIGLAGAQPLEAFSAIIDAELVRVAASKSNKK